MKRAILIPFVLFFCINANAQKNTQHADTSVLKKTEDNLFIKEELFDFGKIPQGKPVNHIFEIQNKGISSLKLDNVQASCGCTTPEWDRNKEIFPGAFSSIKVGYNAASEGVFSKIITITYNESQTKQITIKGEVWKTPTASAPSNTEINELKD
jgi:hypothetical protein